MNKSSEKKSGFSRRKVLPLIGGGLILPFLGFGKKREQAFEEEDTSYQTMLTKDGRLVKVKKQVIDKSKKVESKVSNKGLLNWLTKGDKKP
jgi:hypothetical protein